MLLSVTLTGFLYDCKRHNNLSYREAADSKSIQIIAHHSSDWQNNKNTKKGGLGENLPSTPVSISACVNGVSFFFCLWTFLQDIITDVWGQMLNNSLWGKKRAAQRLFPWNVNNVTACINNDKINNGKTKSNKQKKMEKKNEWMNKTQEP